MDSGFDEAELLDRLKKGEDEAFEEVVRANGGRLLAVARRYLGDEDARDAVQDALLSAFRAIGEFTGAARLSTWLHRIVVNAALVKIRGRKRRPETAIEDLLPRFLADGHQESPAVAWRTAHDDYETAETAAVVRAAIDQLPESYRLVLMLRDIDELDTREVAEALGITTGNVKVRLHRARLALRTLLDPMFREPES